MNRESITRHIYSTVCKTDAGWEAALQQRELSAGLCDDLERWMGEGRRLRWEGTCVYLQLIHCAVQQRRTHCKASILQ